MGDDFLSDWLDLDFDMRGDGEFVDLVHGFVREVWGSLEVCW